MTLTVERHSTIPAAALAEEILTSKIANAPTIALTEWRRTRLTDLHDVRMLVGPNPPTIPDYCRDWAHEVVLIDAELDRRGVCPGPRPTTARIRVGGTR